MISNTGYPILVLGSLVFNVVVFNLTLLRTFKAARTARDAGIKDSIFAHLLRDGKCRCIILNLRSFFGRSTNLKEAFTTCECYYNLHQRSYPKVSFRITSVIDRTMVCLDALFLNAEYVSAHLYLGDMFRPLICH